MLLNYKEKPKCEEEDIIVFSKTNKGFIQITKAVFMSEAYKEMANLKSQNESLKSEIAELRSQISQIATILKEKI